MPRIELTKDFAGLPKGHITGEMDNHTCSTIVRDGNGVYYKEEKEKVVTKELKVSKKTK
jgi:hypothetical protein